MIKQILLTDYSIDYILTSKGELINANTGRVLKCQVGHDGYLTCHLRNKNGERIDVKIHRLVAINFIPKPQEDFTEVNHINGIKTFNWVENLEWLSKEKNIRHYYNLIAELKKERIQLQNEINILKEQRAQLLETI